MNSQDNNQVVADEKVDLFTCPFCKERLDVEMPFREHTKLKHPDAIFGNICESCHAKWTHDDGNLQCFKCMGLEKMNDSLTESHSSSTPVDAPSTAESIEVFAQWGENILDASREVDRLEKTMWDAQVKVDKAKAQFKAHEKEYEAGISALRDAIKNRGQGQLPYKEHETIETAPELIPTSEDDDMKSAESLPANSDTDIPHKNDTNVKKAIDNSQKKEEPSNALTTNVDKAVAETNDEAEAEAEAEWRKIRTTDLPLSEMVRKILIDEGLETISDIVDSTSADGLLTDIRGIGETKAKAIEKVIGELWEGREKTLFGRE